MQPTQDIAYERPYTTTTTTTTTTSTTTPSSSLGDTASLWSPSYDYLIAGSHGNASTPAYFTMMTSGVSYAVEMVANNASSDSRGEGGGTGGGSWEGHNGTDRLVKALWLYLAPVLFFVGIAGNTLTGRCLIVMSVIQMSTVAAVYVVRCSCDIYNLCNITIIGKCICQFYLYPKNIY